MFIVGLHARQREASHRISLALVQTTVRHASNVKREEGTTEVIGGGLPKII